MHIQSWRSWIYKALGLEPSHFERGYWEKDAMRIRCRLRSDAGQLKNETQDKGEETKEDLRRFSETPRIVTLSVTRIEDEIKIAKQKLEEIEAEMRVLLGDPFTKEEK